MSEIVTRFAPSPTGFLHIGGARTALFNWLYARRHGGRFRLRIEDTDRARSTKEAIDAILDGLAWLELDWDDEVVYQSTRAERHVEVAQRLLAEGKAYYCFCSPDELAAMREKARVEGRPMRYDGRWRDRDPAEAPPGVLPVVRFKAPRDGDTVIDDRVQGAVRIANAQLDDMVLLRADGTPTYMHAVVVDDHDMGVTHVIRGVDHLTNAARQSQLFRALGWPPPTFAHVPLIHGPDGAKLSKRHGALSVSAYREMGYLPEAMRNYLLRLGWAHGDDEVISTEQAIAWFDLGAVGRSPARFDVDKLASLNAHYLREADDDRLVRLVADCLARSQQRPLSEAALARLHRGMAGLKSRAKTVVALAESAVFYVTERPLAPNAKAKKLLAGDGARHLAGLASLLADIEPWNPETLEAQVRDYADSKGVKLGTVAQPLRAALTGSNVSPPIFEVMDVLGRDESLARIGDIEA
ncbi:MAG: glutamate--tRNA ligase [Alphaproteobacteria bacterium]